ncbi:regulator of (H+)-ATPase in vacuolar membrane [Teratosphaeriaceae sp. CCFEE 6253]|nr:regulator of (H+)-ATPase in vacuolar membrane [Teratosphaeriaceae sp. CCFEE 6253]
MPSTSPGWTPATKATSTNLLQMLPGAPTASLQGVSTFVFRYKRYVAYISGTRLNVCASPTNLVQALTFAGELVAVVAEAQTGKIAVASRGEVYVLAPVAEGWARVSWEKALCLRTGDEADEVQCLDWGSEGELLVGGSRQLSLFSTQPSSRTSSPAVSPVGGEAAQGRQALWSKPVASPLQHAAFCPSANLIASCSRYDRLVKIWRRLSFEEGLFDYTYLPHPGAVTHVEWRPLIEHTDDRRGSGISSRHEEDPELLYTIANDGVLRIWRTCGMHDPDIVVLHVTIDLVSAIPQSPAPTASNTSHALTPVRYAFTFPADCFQAAVASAVARSVKDKSSHALEHIKETASKSTDVIVALDGKRRMSAWGLRTIGHKRRPAAVEPQQPFHIAHAEDLLLELLAGTNARTHAWFVEDTVHLLVQSFDGHIAWWQGSLTTFLSPSAPGPQRLANITDWSGHTQDLAGVTATKTGESLISWTAPAQIIQWSQTAADRLEQATDSPVLDIAVLEPSSLVATLHTDDIVVWDGKSIPIARAPHGADASQHLRLLASELGEEVLVYDMRGNVTLATVTFHESSRGSERTCTISVGKWLASHGAKIATHVRCVETAQGKALSLAVDRRGLLSRVSIPSARKAFKALPVEIATGVRDPSALEANEAYAAVVSSTGKELTLVDLTGGYVEYEQTLQECVRRLSFQTTSTGYSILAVAFDTDVEVLVQGCYDLGQARSTWTTVYRASVAGTGLRVKTLSWLQGARLAIGAGTAMMLCGQTTSTRELRTDIRERFGLDGSDTSVDVQALTGLLNEPLPLYHPSALSQVVRFSDLADATHLLVRLHERLKFWSEGDDLHHLLSTPQGESTSVADRDDLDSEFVRALMEQLEEKELPAISKAEQETLKLVVQAIALVCEHVNGLDVFALRYLFEWKLQLLHLAQASRAVSATERNGIRNESNFLVPDMSWREIACASHSATQQPLLDILTLYYDNKLTWRIARALGITAWLSDKEALEQVFESLAQSAYRQTSPPDPANASLYFLALHKKQTLLGLWRIATWHKEQRVTTNFLKRDFSQPECRTAAKKNAYALMGKRRFEYAAAFFLLANDAASAISMLAGQCDDTMLAIAVARSHGGSGSPVLRRLLEERLMPLAEKDGDRWMMSWCHTALGEEQEAAEALVRPCGGVRTWQQDDPTTIALYQQIRKGPSRHEYPAVLRAARILRRMGLWQLAVDLASTWAFTPATRAEVSKLDVDSAIDRLGDELPSMLGSSAEPEEPLALPEPLPMVDEKAARERKAAELMARLRAKKDPPIASQKAQPTQFKEPDANSLLNSFGL